MITIGHEQKIIFKYCESTLYVDLQKPLINRFLLEITNENKEEVSVSLFNYEVIPADNTINTKYSNFDHYSLYIMAINDLFEFTISPII
jgi:hypothetical protein